MIAEIYTKTVCPHCVRAKNMLTREGIAYREIDAPANLDQMKSRVLAASGVEPKTVPQIFLDGDYIGGADDLEAYFGNQSFSDFQL